jgi:hypothetical protein
MIRKIFVLLTLSLCASFGAWPQTRPRESLRRLHGVFLYVHPVGKDVEDGGLTTIQVHNAAEKALRQAGITVYREPQPADGSANLIISINIVKHPQGPHLYGADLILEPLLSKVNEFIDAYGSVNPTERE